MINDVDDRIARALDAGYEYVDSPDKLGDVRVAEGTVPGSRVGKPVGNAVTGYLMRIPEKYYQEDQQEKLAKLDATEAAMKPNPDQGQYGEGLTEK